MIEKKQLNSYEYIDNIINTLNNPLVVLDSELRVVAVNKYFYKFFKVKPEDTVGELIYNLGNKQWDIPKLRELLEEILPKKNRFDNYEVEHEFAIIGRRTMLLNAKIIKQVKEREEIILLAIEDITKRREIEKGLESRRKELEVIKKCSDEVSIFAESLIDTVREPLVCLDQDLRVVSVSRSFYEFFNVKPEDTVGELIYNLGNKQWDIPKLRELLEKILPEENTFNGYEVEHNFTTIGRRVMLLNAREIIQALGKKKIILLAIEDITERKNIEKELQLAEETARVSNENHTAILQESLKQSIQTIAATIESRDPYTSGHQKHVAELATAIAIEMDLSEDRVNGIHLASIIHDLGKIHIPAEILSKPGKLSNIEFMLIQTHPQEGYDIMKDVKFPWPIADIILQHHEKLDGSGYPQGLTSEQILLEAKIITVADVVEAITSHRPYRKALGIEVALDEIKKGKGIIYDAQVVDTCLKLFDKDRFHFREESL